jgi:TrmH family RNA methyltransferase
MLQSESVDYPMNKITSRDNPKLKHAKKVREGKVDNEIFVEGLRLAEETIRSGVGTNDALLSYEFASAERGKKMIDSLSKHRIPISVIDDKLFKSLADTKNSQGIVLICERPDSSFWTFVKRYRQGVVPIVIFLNEINNPSNLGAIFRTAEAVGVSSVIVSNNSANAYSPKALRASMGASLRLNIWENAAFDEAVTWSRENGFVITAADIRATKTYTEIDWKVPRLLVMGSEAHGLDSAQISFIDEKIKIPMENAVESLNLAVSCGIILYEAKRQQSQPLPNLISD